MLFSLALAGIIADPAQSLFTYGADGSWGTFYRPDYRPAFGVEFSDPELEEEARAACGDDDLCLFDIAATGDVNIGAATRESGEEQETITELFTRGKFSKCCCVKIFVKPNCSKDLSYFKNTKVRQIIAHVHNLNITHLFASVISSCVHPAMCPWCLCRKQLMFMFYGLCWHLM